jgi:uncharacterized damage-inducible protein DinB
VGGLAHHEQLRNREEECMEAVRLFLFCHDRLHAGVEQALEGLSDEQIRSRPNQQVGSLAWLLWHLVRVEDIAVNRIVADRPQVFTPEEWLPRLNLARRDVGTNMGDDEVADFSATVDPTGLRAYWAAVRRRTPEVAGALRAEELDAPVDPAHLRRVVFDEGMFQGYRPPEAAFAARPRGTWLGSHVLTHGLRHQGEMGLIRSLLVSGAAGAP